MKNSLFSLFFLSLVLLSACKTDADSSSGNTPADPSSSTFTCLIDGESFVANAFITEDISIVVSDEYYRKATGSVISGGDTLSVSINLIASSPTAFQEGASFDAANGSDANRCNGTIYSSGADPVSVEPGTEIPPATALITAYDADQELFSGSFEFEYYNALTETTQTVTNGVFTNISF